MSVRIKEKLFINSARRTGAVPITGKTTYVTYNVYAIRNSEIICEHKIRTRLLRTKDANRNYCPKFQCTPQDLQSHIDNNRGDRFRWLVIGDATIVISEFSSLNSLPSREYSVAHCAVAYAKQYNEYTHEMKSFPPEALRYVLVLGFYNILLYAIYLFVYLLMFTLAYASHSTELKPSTHLSSHRRTHAPALISQFHL